MDWLYLVGGLVALFLGGEALVRGAVGIARWFAVTPLVIGLTVVGFGTSTPELLVSADAALRGVPDIAIGNVLGSNIGNILLILGLAALVSPMQPQGRALRRDSVVMIAAALILVPIFMTGTLGRLSGLALLAGLALYLVLAFLKSADTGAENDATPMPRPWVSGLWLVGGLVALMVGARFLVDGAVSLARDFGLSEAFIGLSIVAVGTSLPELATSLVAAMRRQSAIAIGNIVGSNIFNVLGILGLTAVIAPVPITARFLSFDLPVVLAASLALSVFLWKGAQIGRVAGLALLIAYALYLWAAQG
ncbi:MAG: cation:H+ antiporter [Rhodobacteraceae bacterium HLUCCA12]|nr:MAG: cation:H+ antiporter [Rhodobacteraceae bacterium HLUCCA12]